MHETNSGLLRGEESQTGPGCPHIARLWGSIAAFNNALPAQLKLPDQADGSDAPTAGKPPFRHWLQAPNGAGLGFNGEAVRYYWPQADKNKTETNTSNKTRTKSNNFWIRWEARGGFTVFRRVGLSLVSTRTEKLSFNESSVEHMLKCLVTGSRVKPEAIRVRRFWFF